MSQDNQESPLVLLPVLFGGLPLAGVVCVAVMLLPSGMALAHPALDTAVEHLRQAEFDAATADFERALSSGDLTLAELVVLLSERALLSHAVGDTASVEHDLEYLACIQQQYQFGPQAPPPFVGLWRQLASRATPLALRVEAQAAPGTYRVAAALDGAALSPPPTVRIGVRAHGASFQQYEGADAVYQTPSSGAIEYYVEVVGLGGAVLAHAGTRDNPVSARASGAATGPAGPPLEPSGTRDSDFLADNSTWLLGGGAVLAAGAVLAIVLVATGSHSNDETTVKPIIDF